MGSHKKEKHKHKHHKHHHKKSHHKKKKKHKKIEVRKQYVKKKNTNTGMCQIIYFQLDLEDKLLQNALNCLERSPLKV